MVPGGIREASRYDGVKTVKGGGGGGDGSPL